MFLGSVNDFLTQNKDMLFKDSVLFFWICSSSHFEFYGFIFGFEDVFFSPQHSILMTYVLREKKRDIDNIIKLTVNIELGIYLCFYSYLNMADQTSTIILQSVGIQSGGSDRSIRCE